MYPNLNSSELESARVDSGNLLASKTHMPFDNFKWSNKLGLKDNSNVFDVQCTNPFNVFPIQDTHAIRSGIDLDKVTKAQSICLKLEPEVQQSKWNTILGVWVCHLLFSYFFPFFFLFFFFVYIWFPYFVSFLKLKLIFLYIYKNSVECWLRV